MNEERLKEIIKIAYKLNWVFQPQYIIKDKKQIYSSYPIMSLSEVEKCMIALYDDSELERLREWYKNECLKDKQSVGDKNG